ncbi:MAG TPA: sugar phosphate isomerase/epimerase [Pedobacter sp.]|jgi:sugar phosphate isomerase/epimerase
MITRRNFIQQAGMFATGLMIAPSILSCQSLGGRKRRIGLQLYSLRNEIGKDVRGVISKVAAAGYQDVETYGYSLEGKFWGMTPKEFKAFLQSYNLTSYSGHYGAHEFFSRDKDIKSARFYIDAVTEMGQTYLTVPYMDSKIIQNIADYRHVAGKLNKLGTMCKSAGIKLAYHNHDFEFKNMDQGKSFFDVLLAETDPSLVDFELDLYWVVRAGKDPVDYFKQHPGRFTMWHVKDMDKADNSLNTEIGTGLVDFKKIFNNAEVSGLKQVYVEQENFKIDPYESISKSMIYVKDMKFDIIK